MQNTPIIICENINVRYGDNVILRDVSFEIYPGEIFLIVGGSGSGKSTLLRQIIGLESPESGRIYIGGEELTGAEGEDRLRILNKFGILFQSSGLFASMTLAENIALPLESYTNLSHERIDELIDLKLGAVGIQSFRDYLPSEISGGMRKRAGIARAMALDPDILCFDEPSSGLDPVTAASLDDLIRELNASLKTTMVVVSHDLASINSIAHRIILLDKNVKGIAAMGTPKEMANDLSNKSVYNFFNRIAG